MHSTAAPQFPVVAQWNLTSKRPDEEGATTYLRVEKYADGSGNVFNILPDREVKWFVDGLRFDHEPVAYTTDTTWYHIRRVL
jgi:hypothetical protein